MTPRKLRFAIFGNVFQAKKSASIQKMLSCLAERKADVFIDADFHRFLTESQKISVGEAAPLVGDDFEADFVVSMGGDGTFLKAAARVGDKGIPILGVNMGRLGFLADVSPAEIEECLRSLYEGDYAVESRAAIQVEPEGKRLQGYPCALNDVAILKRDDASMISVRTAINGDYLTTFQADGLVISTPTGSTAYSLSNGGPIIVPQTGVCSITAVAPHSLNIRPIVIADDAEITLDVESRSHNYLIAIDGRSEALAEGTRLKLSKAPHKVNVVKRRQGTYFATLREKMMWGSELFRR